MVVVEIMEAIVATMVKRLALHNPMWGTILTCVCRYVIFSYADSGMSNTLEVEEEEEVWGGGGGNSLKRQKAPPKTSRDMIEFFQGDLDSLVTSFHSSRIQYGLVGVETPKGRKVGLLWDASKYEIIWQSTTKPVAVGILASFELSISWSSGNYPGYLAIILLSISWWSGKGRLPFWGKVPVLTMLTRLLGEMSIFRYISIMMIMIALHHKCVFYVARFMKPIFTWIAREDDDLDVDLIKNQMTKSSNY